MAPLASTLTTKRWFNVQYLLVLSAGHSLTAATNQFIALQTMKNRIAKTILYPALVLALNFPYAHCVQKCYIGALEVYENPRYKVQWIRTLSIKHFRTLTMLDLMEVNTYKLMDCNIAHHAKETVQ